MRYSIASKETMADYVILKLLPLEEQRLEFKPGQFVKLTNKEGVGRPYSICSPPSWPYLEFLFHIIPEGKFSSYVKEAHLGDEVEVSRAAGHFVYEGEKKAVFVAGGSGIAPVMAIVRHIVSRNIKGDFHLFYSNRHFYGTAYLSELLSYAEAGYIKLNLTFTREEVKGFMNRRFVPEDVLGIEGLEEYTLFVCGNMAMAKTFRQALQEKVAKIKIEAWG